MPKLGGQWPDRELPVAMNRMRCPSDDGGTWTTLRIRELRERMGPVPYGDGRSGGNQRRRDSTPSRDLHRLGPPPDPRRQVAGDANSCLQLRGRCRWRRTRVRGSRWACGKSSPGAPESPSNYKMSERSACRESDLGDAQCHTIASMSAKQLQIPRMTASPKTLLHQQGQRAYPPGAFPSPRRQPHLNTASNRDLRRRTAASTPPAPGRTP